MAHDAMTEAAAAAATPPPAVTAMQVATWTRVELVSRTASPYVAVLAEAPDGTRRLCTAPIDLEPEIGQRVRVVIGDDGIGRIER